MRYRLFVLYVSLCWGVVLSSCSHRNLAYFQDITTDQYSSEQISRKGIQLPEVNPIRLRTGDRISIVVNSKNPELASLFNLPLVTARTSFGNTNVGQQVSTYCIDSAGCITFPVLGTLEISGMTRLEVSEKIKGRLIAENLILDPVVTVEFMDMSFSILGEVRNPGRYTISKDRITILEAISMAGDLTITGVREDIVVLRMENGKQTMHKVNLYSLKELVKSPVYGVQQNDVIYIAPNKKRSGESAVNGNTFVSTSFWISVSSLLISIINLVLRL